MPHGSVQLLCRIATNTQNCSSRTDNTSREENIEGLPFLKRLKVLTQRTDSEVDKYYFAMLKKKKVFTIKQINASVLSFLKSKNVFCKNR